MRALGGLALGPQMRDGPEAIPEHLKEQSYADFRPNRKMVIPRPIKINMIRTAKS
jgi:hypothetical protein